MKRSFFKNAVIPPLSAFLGYQVIWADQVGERPDGPHATYKITLPYSKGAGKPNYTYKTEKDKFLAVSSENYRATISFSTFSMDDEISQEMAQNIHDWFNFHGSELLDDLGIVIVEVTDVTNRDAFILEGYERRYGFDIIIRHNRSISKVIDFFEHIEIERK